MAVERLTDYTRRIWTALGPDAPEGHDIHVNDVIYYMDISQCCIVTNVYPDGSIDCETLPDVGGGGGGGGFELVASGDYTQALETNTTVTIPIPDTVNEADVIFIVKDSVTQGVTQTFAWLRQYPTALPSAITSVFGDIFRYIYYEANGTAKDGVQAGHLWWSPATSISFQPAVSGAQYRIRAGLYHWYIWKVTL